MDNKTIRKLNLINLIEGFESDGKFAEFVGMDPSHVSQIKTNPDGGRHNMGDSIARKIEIKFGNPKGWMDALQQDESSKPAQVNMVRDNHNPIQYRVTDHEIEITARIVNVINTAVGAEVFSKTSPKQQAAFIKNAREYLDDEEISELSDQSIAKLMRINADDKG